MMMPSTWNWYKYDKRNIFDINNRFFKTKITTFPSIGTLDYVKYRFIHKIKWVSFLDFFEYDKFKAIHILKNDLPIIRTASVRQNDLG